MTSHQKLQLLRHLNATLKTYQWNVHRHRQGFNCKDPGMKAHSQERLKVNEEAAADCQQTIEWVQKMETKG